MKLFPAIDLRGGKVVRLAQGNPDRETRFADDAAAQAELFAKTGFRALHIVDLDAALENAEGAALNARAVRRIRAATNLPVQLGGGIRSESAAARWLEEAGVARILLSTLPLRDPKAFARISARWRERVWVSVDLRDGVLADRGWRARSEIPARELVRRAEQEGAGGLVRTDINRDGTGLGIDAQAAARFARATALPVIAAGGVAGEADLAELAATRALEGAILGRALYDGSLAPQRAVALERLWRGAGDAGPDAARAEPPDA